MAAAGGSGPYAQGMTGWGADAADRGGVWPVRAGDDRRRSCLEN
ncbi:hypothetical protein SSBG_00972 [Streptomyces sp. SPB074]|nr:hypothetical protein SSBG_00972 [Streptomyces sp. SPB074]